MKLIEAGTGQFTFRLELREKQALLQVLKLYPLIPVSHQRLTKSNQPSEGQQLLDEALASQRRENKKLVEAFMQSSSVFRDDEAGCHFFVQAAQMEWLLQVLNDVRVGSWLTIGSPEELTQLTAALNEKTAPYFWALKVADHFLVGLLHALGERKADTEE